MFCTSCGFELADDANFCPGCGNKKGLSNQNLSSNTASAQAALPINNTFIWLLAFAPIFTTVVELILSNGQGLGAASLVIAIIFNTVFAVLDEGAVKKAGYESSNLIWAIFIVPVYIWKRATITKQTPTYFWVWIACFVLDILIAVA